MPQPPAVRPRTSGGFNQGLGQFNDHLDEAAMEDAVQQKAMAQQGTSSAQSTTGGSALGAHNPADPQAGGAPAAQPPKPREVGSIQDELIKRPAQDVVAGLKQFFDINKLLGINPDKDDPQTKAKKQQMLQRWQKLKAEDQEVAKRIFQKEMQKKQQEEQEKQLRKQQEEQRKAQQMVIPSGKSSGAQGPGAKKPADVQKLEQDRKQLSSPQSAG